MWVVSLKQIDFPVAFPFLDLFLAVKRGSCGFVNLKPNGSFDLVPLGEAGNEPVLVFPNSPRKIGCQADVQGSVVLVGEETDAKHRVCE